MKSSTAHNREKKREHAQKAGKSPNGRISLSELGAETYDLVVIGGGISGATILWDAALRGMKAVLLERNDYASGTTQATSKLIHGGLRYLKNGEFGLVRESLRERRTLARIAQHALRPEAFLMPMYHEGPNPWVMGAGLKLYDLLSFDRNRGVSDDLKLPSSRYLNRTETLAEEPGILHNKLRGAFLYYDYANVNPERLCSEFIFSARAMGARARNYTEATGIVHHTRSGYSVAVRDRQTGERGTISGRAVVNAGGPWADYIEDMMSGSNHHKLRRSRGIHAVTKRIVHDKTVVLFREDKTHLFLIPWRNRTIIGTTDAMYDGHPDGLRVGRKDVEELLGGVNRLFGGPRLGLDDVVYTYAGLRPLVEETGSKSTYNASRKTEIHHHKQAGHPGFFTVLGGKYTTSRALAEKVVDQVAEVLPGPWKPCATETSTLLGGQYTDRLSLENSLRGQYPNVHPDRVETLVSRYGSEAGSILARAPAGLRTVYPANPAGNAGLLGRGRGGFSTANGEIYTPEEIDHILEREDVAALCDLYFRRAGIGTPGAAPADVTDWLLDKAAASLGWTRAQRQKAGAELAAKYEL